MKKIIPFLLLFISTPNIANTIIPVAGSDLQITIYNNNRAFINDTRSVNVNQGKQKLVYEGVPSSVVTQSVVPSFSGVNTKLYSQNYVYDLISLDSMLKNSIDQEVSYYTNGENPMLQQGKILSTSPNVMLRNEDGLITTLEKPTQVLFNKVPKNMITKPSLVWNTETQEAGKLDIDLKYLTNNIGWSSDYVLNLKPSNFDLKGWITVNNNSGVAYENAKISVIAGELNTASKPRYLNRNKVQSMEIAMADQVAQESFSGYHLYQIPFRETIDNKSQKQIAFIDKNQINYQQYGKAHNSHFGNYSGEQKLKFANTIEFTNSKDNNMGIALPAGIVRMYKKSTNGQTHFIGESRINNTPENENVKLTVGTLFDVVGEKRISKHQENKELKQVETTYTLRNQGNQAVELRLEERIPTYGKDIKLSSSCGSICSVEKKTAFVREFKVRLAAKESYNFTSNFEVYFKKNWF